MRVKKTEFKIVQKRADAFLENKGYFQDPLIGAVKEDSIRAAYRAIFTTAQRKKLKEVIFPPVGLSQGFGAIAAAKIVSQEILRFCRASPGMISKIVLNIPDRQTSVLFKEQVYGYLRHVQEDLGCGPYVTVDILIEMKEGLVLIERTNPPFGLAIPGGFVDNFESLEDAARREAKEETHLDLVNLKQFHVYSDPKRDPRFHTVSTVFIAQGKGKPQFGDDAKGLKIIPYRDLLKYPYAFDHSQIIRDYLKTKGTHRGR